MELVVKRCAVMRGGVFLRCCCSLDRRAENKFYSTVLNTAEYQKCYTVLNVKTGSDQETVRQAFIQLVKRFHPDSGSDEANAQKFQEIERAYRKLQQKFHAERWLDRRDDGAGEYGLYYKEKKSNENIEVVQLDIKHTAPQHRQYLSYDGFGTGTPTQRHKQYQKQRASTAIENVYNHRISRIQQAETLNEEQSLVVKDKERAKNIKTRYGMERLVEDLIQESMARGDFDNLSGKGKPLSKKQDHYNPYVDLVTHKLNQVMIDNGFMPEWITLQKEIREDVVQLRERLWQARDSLGAAPLSPDSTERWAVKVEALRPDVTALNSKIGKLNLVVPLLRNQMILFDLDKEAQKIIEKPQRVDNFKPQPLEKTRAKGAKEESLVGLIVSMFNR